MINFNFSFYLSIAQNLKTFVQTNEHTFRKIVNTSIDDDKYMHKIKNGNKIFIDLEPITIQTCKQEHLNLKYPEQKNNNNKKAKNMRQLKLYCIYNLTKVLYLYYQRTVKHT